MFACGIANSGECEGEENSFPLEVKCPRESCCIMFCSATFQVNGKKSHNENLLRCIHYSSAVTYPNVGHKETNSPL